MEIRAGTSGYAYKPWKGNFYPEDLPDREMLRHYAAQLPTVEINNTFYRMPTAKMIDRWSSEVPDTFRFVLKATRRITHHARLGAVDEMLAYLLEATGGLGEKLGAHLFQLPPTAKRDTERLATFLRKVPANQRVAMEFRHESWFDESTFALMRDHDAALVVADGEKVEVPFVATASWGYLRLRAEDYDDAALRAWAARVGEQEWKRAFVFFKHEDAGAGPRMAARFLEMVAATGC